MSGVYYNDTDAFACAWLRELMKAGQIPDGEIDTRSIADVSADDVRGFRHCHFFAGIGGWAYALKLAGWPDDRPVWTGSCPCQPFSMAGEGKGPDDPRHLWPSWFRIWQVVRPAVVFSEQIAGPDGLYWVDMVCADLEAIDYAVGTVGLPAAGVNAPHRRNRLFLVADADSAGCAVIPSTRLHAERQSRHDPVGRRAIGAAWTDFDWVRCSDGAARPIEPGTFPLVARTAGDVGRLRGYGNAIVPHVAATFIQSYLDIRP